MVVENLSYSYGENKVLDDVSFQVQEGKITTIIGANGCGKTTLFNLMTKKMKQRDGMIRLKGKDIRSISLKQFARQVSIVHQHNFLSGDLTVQQLVGYGRLANTGLYKSKTEEDERWIDWAMKATDIEDLKQRYLSQLSGGQRQRAWIAMALAQNTKILFLDEPTTFLDVRYQIETLKLVEELNQKYDITIVMVLHDMNQALNYSHEVIAMKKGKIIAAGNPELVITPDLIQEVYGIELKVGTVDGRKVVCIS